MTTVRFDTGDRLAFSNLEDARRYCDEQMDGNVVEIVDGDKTYVFDWEGELHEIKPG
jgi:hypothetical protein